MFGSLWLWSKLIDVGWDVGIGILGCDGTMYYRFHVSGPFVRMDSVRKEHWWRKALVLERIFSFITSPFVRESNLKRKNNWCLPNSHSWGCYSWRTKILPPLGVVQLDTNYTTRRWFQTFVSTSIWGDEAFYTNCNLVTYCIFLIWIETT